jgi:hypothetical protein
MRSGSCRCWFEKLPEGRATGGKTSVDVCLRGDIVVPEILVCARQRPPQFPLRPYTESRERCPILLVRRGYLLLLDLGSGIDRSV